MIIIIFFRIFPVPAWVMLGLWFGFQIVGGFSAPSDEGGVAYWAHAGGFLAGVVLTVPLWLRKGARRSGAAPMACRRIRRRNTAYRASRW